LGSIANSPVTVNAAGSSASGAPSGSGNTLTLVLNMSFTPAFDGNRVIYTAARDMGEANIRAGNPWARGPSSKLRRCFHPVHGVILSSDLSI
jgi:hypothetical protein